MRGNRGTVHFRAKLARTVYRPRHLPTQGRVQLNTDSKVIRVIPDTALKDRDPQSFLHEEAVRTNLERVGGPGGRILVISLEGPPFLVLVRKPGTVAAANRVEFSRETKAFAGKLKGVATVYVFLRKLFVKAPACEDIRVS